MCVCFCQRTRVCTSARTVQPVLKCIKSLPIFSKSGSVYVHRGVSTVPSTGLWHVRVSERASHSGPWGSQPQFCYCFNGLHASFLCGSALHVNATKTITCAPGCRVRRPFTLRRLYARTQSYVSAANMSRSRAMRRNSFSENR